MQQLEAIVAEKDEKLKSVTTELERIQKALRLFNNRKNRLDRLITLGKSFGDHSGVGYKGESSGTKKTVFIKSGLLIDSVDDSNYKPVSRFIATEGEFAVQ